MSILLYVFCLFCCQEILLFEGLIYSRLKSGILTGPRLLPGISEQLTTQLTAHHYTDNSWLHFLSPFLVAICIFAFNFSVSDS